MAPAANTNSLPNREKAQDPASSHNRHASKSMESQSRAVAARSRTGSDAREWSHVEESFKQAQFDTGREFSDQKPTTSTTMTPPPEHDVIAEIEKHLRLSGPRGVHILPAFRDASTHPPITPDSLAELDMPRIINNPKLRHDVNFDRELHFRPNLDGARGKQKIKSADDYWKALEAELYMLDLSQRARAYPDGSVSPGYWESLMRESRKRLPSVFEVVRDILTTLVPDQDQAKIIERLDVDLLIQQIDNGVCDLVDLADWLGKVLKNHCAPMRDNLVDKMRKAITKGAQQADQKLMVSGLRQLLNLLEAMKLDVANHQIRHMRPLLIADTVNFQKRYNEHPIGLGKLNPEVSRVWLWQEFDTLSGIEDATPSYLDTLTQAILRDLLFCSSTTSLTSTFYLDLDRLRTIRVDMHNMICHRVCGDILEEMLGTSRSEVSKALTALRTSLTAIVGTQGLWTERIENIAVEVVRIVLTLEGRTQPYDADLIALAERKLQQDLEPTSSAFCLHAQDMLNRLLPKVKECVNAHIRFPAIELQDALVAPMPATPTHSFGMGAVCEPVAVARSMDPDLELVRRFSHVIVLHWQVWADLVYLVVPEREQGFGLSSPSPSASPEPVTRAIFDPGNKFIPKAVTSDSEDNGMPTPAPSPDPESDLVDGDQTDPYEGLPFFPSQDHGH